MNMDFPHPRHKIGLQDRRSNFAALMATVTARQAGSRTVRAMLTHSAPAQFPAQFVADPLDGRIAYFGSVVRKADPGVFGAFLPDDLGQGNAVFNKDESAVYPDSSMIGKFDTVNQALPAVGQELRGREV
jgi:hypothetical protein